MDSCSTRGRDANPSSSLGLRSEREQTEGWKITFRLPRVGVGVVFPSSRSGSTDVLRALGTGTRGYKGEEAKAPGGGPACWVSDAAFAIHKRPIAH